MKKFWLPLLLVLGLGSAHAAPTPPDVAVKETTEKMRSLIAANHAAYKADKNKFYAVVDEVLVPRFDVPGISKLVLGRNWRSATPEQRTRFQSAFKNSLIRNYADALLENYDSADAKFQSLRLVGGEISPDDGSIKREGRIAGEWHTPDEGGRGQKRYRLTPEGVAALANMRAAWARFQSDMSLVLGDPS